MVLWLLQQTHETSFAPLDSTPLSEAFQAGQESTGPEGRPPLGHRNTFSRHSQPDLPITLRSPAQADTGAVRPAAVHFPFSPSGCSALLPLLWSIVRVPASSHGMDSEFEKGNLLADTRHMSLGPLQPFPLQTKQEQQTGNARLLKITLLLSNRTTVSKR